MSVLEQVQPSAQNYEELKSNASTMMSNSATAQLQEEEHKVVVSENQNKLTSA